jgi:PAS domain S-box-containing protein
MAINENILCFATDGNSLAGEDYIRKIFHDAVFYQPDNFPETPPGNNQTPVLRFLIHQFSSDQLLSKLENFRNCGQKILFREKHISTSDLDAGFLDFFTEIVVINPDSTPSMSVLEKMQDYENLLWNLKESERKYKTLVETLPGIIYRCKNDSDWTMLFLSPKIARLTGYSARQLLHNKKLSYSDIIVPKDREKVWLAVQKAIKSNRSFAVEYRITTSAGRTKWVWEQGKAIRDASGRLYIEGVIIDISERKQLAQRVEIMRTLILGFSSARDVTQMVEIIKSELEKVIPATRLKLMIYDRKTNQFLTPYLDEGRECFSNQPGQFDLKMLVLKRKRSMLLVRREIDKLNRQGKIQVSGDMPAVWLGVPLFAGDLPTGVISLCHHQNELAIDKADKDLLEFIALQVSVALIKKQAEEESDKLLQALEQIPAAVFITGLDFVIIYVNRKSEVVTGFESSEMIGKTPNLLNPGFNSPEAIEQIKSTLMATGTWEGEFENRKKDGNHYYESIRISVIKNHRGVATHFVMLKNDITNQKNLERKLTETTRRAEQSDNLKSAFMANMSHEIRTPMNAIIGFSEMLKNDDFSQEEKMQFIDLVLDNSRSLMSKLDNIIDITKIETGKLKLNKSLCSANKILYDHYYLLLKAKEKIDKTDIEIFPRQFIENENFLFLSDAYRISQVLQNLLENSLKYTFSGTIEIGYKIEKTGGDEWIDFYVKDTGVGIPQEQAEVLFDKYRTTGSDARNASIATGFGLYISKNVASLLGGDLTFETSTGNGTTFHLKVPYLQAGTPKYQSQQIATKAEKRALHYPDKTVLIVEDVEANFRLLEVMLRKTNVKIERAYNGKQAVDYIKGGKHADLILMDVRMPVMNGYEATELIKQFDPSIPVIIQTAFAFSNDREKGFGSGCDEYLSKPIKARDLYLLLEKFFD